MHNEMHLFQVSSLMSFDKLVYPSDHHHNQLTEYLHYRRKSPLVPLQLPPDICR